jgi:PAS domain S-box-containing protein
MENHCLTKDGREIILLTDGVPILDSEGNLLGYRGVDKDITARKRAEEALREAHEQLDATLNALPDLLFEVDRHGRFYDFRAPDPELLYTSPQEFLGQTVSDVLPQEAASIITDTINRAVETGQHTSAVYPLETPAGAGWFELSIAAKGDPKKPDGRLIVLARDITDRQQAQAERERLLAAEHEQRTLAETLREVTLALTAQTSHAAVMDEILRQAQRIVPHSTGNIALLENDALRIVHGQGYQTSAWEECIFDMVQPLAGWPLDAEVVQSRKPLVIPDTRQEPRWVVLDEAAWIQSYLSVPICLRDRVLGLLRLDGDTPGQFSAEDARRLQPLASAAAIAIENAHLVENLETELMTRTAEIVAEREKSETILRSVGDAIIMSDLEMRIQYVNLAFTTLTGYTPREVMGRHVGFLFREAMSEQDQQSLRLAMAKNETWQWEVSSLRKDGRTYDAEVIIASVQDADGNLAGYVSSHHDISRIKDLERARSRFVTNVSHQLRTPVTTLKTSIYLLRKGTHPEKADRYLQMMEEEIAQLIDLIQDILEMTTLDSGRAVTAWEPVSLPTVVGDIITRFHDQAEASGLTLVTTPIPPDLPVIKGDQARLFQALKEIVENAIIFTPAGGQVTVDVETVEDEGWSWVTITVRDTGPGISPAEQERVFDRFFRGSLAESGHVPGTGLGLSIAYEIMRAHGGRVTVESPSAELRTGELGQGSAFTLWLRSAPR